MIKPGLSTIALDIGSTSIKCALIEPESGELVRCIKRPFPEPLGNLPAGHVEVDPNAVVQAVRSVLLELSEHSSGHCSVWVCGQMGGVVLADDKGRAKSNYISWRDQRTSARSSNGRSFLETIRLDWPENVFSVLGRELQPGSTSALLHWLSESRKLADGVLPLSIADYCISHLTQQPGCMHPTHAIGLLDLNKLDWHYAALERIGLGDLWWPELMHHTNSIGRYSVGGKIFDFHGSYGDQQCALYGSGLATNELSINVSTGSQVSILSDQFQSGPYQTRCYFHGKWLNTITHLPAGRSLNAWVNLLSELADSEGKSLEHVWETIAKKMEQVTHTDLQTDLSLFPSPVGSTGSLSNITLENLNVGNLFLAACTSMVENYFHQSQRLSTKEPWQSIVVSGGLGASLPKFLDLIRSRFQRTVRESSGEETLLGLARLANHNSSQQ
jgi:sugar (pentulose or hexulose) kinase